MTNRGVPNRSFSAATETPATASPPSSFRSTVLAHIGSCRAFRSSGTCSHSGARGEALAVSCALMGLHPFRRRNAQQVKSVGQHLAGGVIEPQPGAVEVGDWFLAHGGNAAGVVPAVVSPRDGLKVTGHAV